MGVEDFKDYFYYDETSPSFLRRVKDIYGGHKYTSLLVSKDSVAGGITKGYWVCSMNGVRYFAHRIIYSLFYGEIPKNVVIDHIDGNPLNNCISNLRAIPQSLNSRNSRVSKSSPTGIAGVFKSTKVNKEGKLYNYFCACYTDLNAHKHFKYFSIDSLGEEIAKYKAMEYRNKMIEELNGKGAGYTDRHGK